MVSMLTSTKQAEPTDMDDQRYKQRTTIGLIVLAAVFVWLGYLTGPEWFAGALRLIGA